MAMPDLRGNSSRDACSRFKLSVYINRRADRVVAREDAQSSLQAQVAEIVPVVEELLAQTPGRYFVQSDSAQRKDRPWCLIQVTWPIEGRRLRTRYHPDGAIALAYGPAQGIHFSLDPLEYVLLRDPRYPLVVDGRVFGVKTDGPIRLVSVVTDPDLHDTSKSRARAKAKIKINIACELELASFMCAVSKLLDEIEAKSLEMPQEVLGAQAGRRVFEELVLGH